MVIGIDLSSRQAARVLEQARRTKARLELDPRNLAGETTLYGRLVDREGDLLHVALEPGGPPINHDALAGAFCDIRIVLLGELYMFNTCVVETSLVDNTLQLALAAPTAMQVANRRQFERRGVNQWVHVKLWSEQFASPQTAVLFNLGAGGLACRVSRGELEDALLIDDELIASFNLPGYPEKFELPVVICNKLPLDDKQYLVVGLEFIARPDDPTARRSLERLREVLFALPDIAGEAEGQ